MEENKEQPIWKWFIAVFSLALVSISSGTPNIYPSFQKDIESMLNISSGTALFMLTGGVLLLYITLPAGIVMDKFGVTITHFIAVGITVLSYSIMIFCKSIPGLFITLYLIGALGSASLFICCLQVALSRTPAKIKGISCSIVSASLSLSFGLWIQVFNSGGIIFNCTENCTLEQFKAVVIFMSIIIIVFSIIAWFFYRQFEPAGEGTSENKQNESKPTPWHILKSPKLYLLASLMLLTVFDGLTVISGGSKIWELYGHPSGRITYGTAFSVTNCIATLLLSMLIDFLIEKYKFTRVRCFSVTWISFIIIHILVACVFSLSSSKTALGIVISMMGIPFGFGLTHVPTLTSDIFGNDVYGFAFGIVQIGSIISAASTMPIISQLEKGGIVGVFVIQILLHIITGLLLFFTKHKREMYDISPAVLIDEKQLE
jgi:MFS family permease